MNNSMEFSNMTRLCHNIIKTYQSQTNQSPASALGFYEKLIEKTEESEAMLATFRSNMTMEEYKLYIYDKIASLPVHPSNMQDSVAVHISDEGFEAMKNDPEYEKWVLDTLERNFMCYDPWSSTTGGKFMVFHFGATKKECRSEIWHLGFRHGNGRKVYEEKAKDSFWERRKRRRKELLEQLEELEEAKAVAKRIAKSEYFAQLAALKPEDGEAVHPRNIDLIAMQIFSTLKSGILLEPLSSKKVKS
ncbi:MAG: hypothetical protein J1D87_04560 [Lachnospiraceae bacterium]|nr:hypothetical protein [Lachnospiraceae bacterium]